MLFFIILCTNICYNIISLVFIKINLMKAFTVYELNKKKKLYCIFNNILITQFFIHVSEIKLKSTRIKDVKYKILLISYNLYNIIIRHIIFFIS